MATGGVQLRDYQQAIIADTRREMARYKSVLIESPTGSGKTLLSAFMLDSASKKGKRCWFVVHRQELVQGTANTFDKCGIPYGIVAAGFPMNPYAAIQICSIQTLVNRLSRLPRPDMIVFDECHHLGAATWDKVSRAYPQAWQIGLSATPVRLDGKGLGRWFKVMVRGPQVRWLIENGYLSDYLLYTPGAPNLSGVHTRAGDYVTAELDEIMRGKAIVGGIVKHWQKQARGLRTIGFAPSVKSSQDYVAAFRQAGVMAVHLDAKMNREDRRRAGQAFADGQIDILFNCDLFSEGFDLAAMTGRDVTVESVILARPTKSLGLHRQQIGRALRKKDRKAVILDHAGNCARMQELYGTGLPCDEVEWTLDDKPKRKSEGGATIPMRQCERCYCCHKPAPVCPSCGFVYPIKSREIDEVEAEMVEVDAAAMRRQRLAEQGQARTLEELIELGKRRGYKHPEKWAGHLYTARMAGRQA